MENNIDKTQVRDMFDGIAESYDFLNHFLTLGIDVRWRKQAIKRINQKEQCNTIVDVATGTGDLAIALAKACKPKQILGIDFSQEMLNRAEPKVIKQGLEQIITLQQGNGEALTIEDNYADLVTIAFGIRNFQNPDKGLSEFYRILKPGGQLIVLEFSQVKQPLLRILFQFYFKQILPAIGKRISKHPEAYNYLPESVNQFAEGQEFCDMMRKAGFHAVQSKPLSFGIATIYWGFKTV